MDRGVVVAYLEVIHEVLPLCSDASLAPVPHGPVVEHPSRLLGPEENVDHTVLELVERHRLIKTLFSFTPSLQLTPGEGTNFILPFLSISSQST